jgi:transposase InsO family protein
MSHFDANRPATGLPVSFSGKPEDWPDWKYLFESYIGQLGLANYLTIADPWTDEEFEAQEADAKSQAGRLLYLLLTATASSKTAQAIIRRCRKSDGVAAWIALSKHFEPNDRRRKQTLTHELMNPRPIVPAAFEEWMTRLYTLKSQLEHAGGTFDEDSMASSMLKALPPHLADIKTHLRLYACDKPFEDQVAIVRNHLQDLLIDGPPLDQPTAFMAYPTKQCAHCKRKGHTKAECYQLHPNLRPDQYEEKSRKRQTQEYNRDQPDNRRRQDNRQKPGSRRQQDNRDKPHNRTRQENRDYPDNRQQEPQHRRYAGNQPQRLQLEYNQQDNQGANETPDDMPRCEICRTPRHETQYCPRADKIRTILARYPHPEAHYVDDSWAMTTSLDDEDSNKVNNDHIPDTIVVHQQTQTRRRARTTPRPARTPLAMHAQAIQAPPTNRRRNEPEQHSPDPLGRVEDYPGDEQNRTRRQRPSDPDGSMLRSAMAELRQTLANAAQIITPPVPEPQISMTPSPADLFPQDDLEYFRRLMASFHQPIVAPANHLETTTDNPVNNSIDVATLQDNQARLEDKLDHILLLLHLAHPLSQNDVHHEHANVCTSNLPSKDDHICATASESLTRSPQPDISASALASTRSALSVCSGWIIDSGASQHMTHSRDDFIDYQTLPQGETCVRVANGTAVPVRGKGRVKINIRDTNGSLISMTTNALHVPNLHYRLLSVPTLTNSITGGHSVTFNGAQCFLKLRSTPSPVLIKSVQKQYILYTEPPPPNDDDSDYERDDSDDEEPEQQAAPKFAKTESANASQLDLWHQRLGHVHHRAIQTMAKQGQCTGIRVETTPQESKCPICPLGKSTRQPTGYAPILPATYAGQVLSMDTAGPLAVPTPEGHRYALVFVDHYSRFKWCKTMETKRGAYNAIHSLLTSLQRRGIHVKTLHSDGAGEFTSEELRQVTEPTGTDRSYSAPYSPNQNGIAERAIRTIFEMARCMLKQAALPDQLWGLATEYATFLLNRLPTRALNGRLPLIVWGGDTQLPPNLGNVRTFGARAFAHIEDRYRKKLNDKAREGIFVGIPTGYAAYKILTGFEHGAPQFTITRNATFDENHRWDQAHPLIQQITRHVQSRLQLAPRSTTMMPQAMLPKAAPPPIKPPTPVPQPIPPPLLYYVPSPIPRPPPFPMAEEPSRALPTEATEEHSTSTEDPETEEQHNETQVPETEEQPNTGEQPRGPESDRASIEPPTDAPQRRSIRSTAGKPATRFEPANTANVIQSHAFVASLLDDSPMSYTEAMRSPHATEWRAAFKTELKAILDNGTFSFVDPPDYKINPVKTKWIGKVKRRADGEVERFKGRLVAKGFTQVYGCDYFETFAPVVRAQTLRTTLALTAIHNLRTSVIDIDTAFLNGVLDEEVYIKTPDGFWDLMQEIDPRLRQHLDNRYPNGRFVIRLAKGLYGLKQSAKVWNDNLNEHLLSRSFQRSKADPCAYYKQLDKTNFIIILTYVDDIVIAATKPIQHQRSKHIHVRFHFTREAVERGEISIEYVSTSAQLADYLTKPLPKEAFFKCRGDLQE